MATRAEVETIVAAADPRAHLIFHSCASGRNVGQRPGLEGGGAFLVLLDFDLTGAIEDGEFTVRPAQLMGGDHSFTRRQRRALEKRRRELRERVERQNAADAERAIEREASYRTQALPARAQEPHGANRALPAASGEAEAADAPTRPEGADGGRGLEVV